MSATSNGESIGHSADAGKRSKIMDVRLVMATALITEAAFGLDVAHWVAERGGVVHTDARSRVTGIQLGVNWVTDSDPEILAGCMDLSKLDLSSWLSHEPVM